MEVTVCLTSWLCRGECKVQRSKVTAVGGQGDPTQPTPLGVVAQYSPQLGNWDADRRQHAGAEMMNGQHSPLINTTRETE